MMKIKWEGPVVQFVISADGPTLFHPAANFSDIVLMNAGYPATARLELADPP